MLTGGGGGGFVTYLPSYRINKTKVITSNYLITNYTFYGTDGNGEAFLCITFELPINKYSKIYIHDLLLIGGIPQVQTTDDEIIIEGKSYASVKVQWTHQFGPKMAVIDLATAALAAETNQIKTIVLFCDIKSAGPENVIKSLARDHNLLSAIIWRSKYKLLKHDTITRIPVLCSR